MRVDEILEALPEVGCQLWMLCDNGPTEGWYCVLHAQGSVPKCGEPNNGTGRGPTPLAALVEACTQAGLNVEDDGT